MSQTQEQLNEETTVGPVAPEVEQETSEAPAPVDFESLSTQEKIEFLQDQRVGTFAVPLLHLDDLKYLRGKMQGEYEFTGPQEAFMLMNAFMGIESAYATYSKVLKEAQKNKAEAPVIALSAAAIEGAIYYTGRVKGKGIEQAQRTFRIAMALNGAAKKMREIDELVKEYREKLKAEETPADSTPADDQNPITTES